MSVAAAPRVRSGPASQLWPALGLALAAAIAWFQPFDIAFAWATRDSPPLRAAAIVLMALVGAAVGRRIGLTVEGSGEGRPLRDALVAAVVVGVFCALCDWAWRPVLHPPYVAALTRIPLGVRVLGFAARALNENIIYRLFLGSLLIWALGRVWKAPDGRPARGAFWTGFILAQGVNVWVNVTGLAPVTPAGLLHDLFRYVAPGVVWGWLYWRRGFAANELASTSVHLVFQPLVTLGL
jgi:hypothetical protein